MNPEKVAETLEKAADILAVNGVYKGDYRGVNNDSPAGYCFCAMGAIRYACGGDPNFASVSGTGLDYFLSSKAVAALSVALEGSVPDWNDNPDVSSDEIIRTFREAARKVRSGEIKA